MFKQNGNWDLPYFPSLHFWHSKIKIWVRDWESRQNKMGMLSYGNLGKYKLETGIYERFWLGNRILALPLTPFGPIALIECHLI